MHTLVGNEPHHHAVEIVFTVYLLVTLIKSISFICCLSILARNVGISQILAVYAGTGKSTLYCDFCILVDHSARLQCTHIGSLSPWAHLTPRLFSTLVQNPIAQATGDVKPRRHRKDFCYDA